jgi:hypothetical protein
VSEKIFNKVYTFSFSDTQLKKILVDLLVLSGEVIPVDVHADLEPDSFEQYESDVKVVSDNGEEISETFSIRLSFTDSDLEEFRKVYNEELESRHTKAGDDTGEVIVPLPENVWTQETQLPCGKD